MPRNLWRGHTQLKARSLFRDSATGSTLDFDSEDEGSNPSPEARELSFHIGCSQYYLAVAGGYEVYFRLLLDFVTTRYREVVLTAPNLKIPVGWCNPGNTLRSERRNEGSNPSPAAKIKSKVQRPKLSKRYFD